MSSINPPADPVLIHAAVPNAAVPNVPNAAVPTAHTVQYTNTVRYVYPATMKRKIEFEEDKDGELVQVEKKVILPDFVFTLPAFDQFLPSRIEVYGTNVRFDYNRATRDFQVFQVNDLEERVRIVKIVTVVTPDNPTLKKFYITEKPLGVIVKAKPKTADGRDVTFRIQYL